MDDLLTVIWDTRESWICCTCCCILPALALIVIVLSLKRGRRVEIQNELWIEEL